MCYNIILNQSNKERIKMTTINKITTVLSKAHNIIVTPISYKPEELGALDYAREMANNRNNFDVIWDDSPANNTKVGDLFSFITGQGRSTLDVGEGYCQIRKVIAVLPNNARPKHWNIPEHTDRHVLILSDILYEGTWVELSEACGKKGYGKRIEDKVYLAPRQGTKRWNITSTEG